MHPGVPSTRHTGPSCCTAATVCCHSELRQQHAADCCRPSSCTGRRPAAAAELVVGCLAADGCSAAAVFASCCYCEVSTSSQPSCAAGTQHASVSHWICYGDMLCVVLEMLRGPSPDCRARRRRCRRATASCQYHHPHTCAKHMHAACHGASVLPVPSVSCHAHLLLRRWSWQRWRYAATGPRTPWQRGR